MVRLIKLGGLICKVVRFGDILECSVYVVSHEGSLYMALIFPSPIGSHIHDSASLCKLVKTAADRAAGDTGGSYSSFWIWGRLTKFSLSTND